MHFAIVKTMVEVDAGLLALAVDVEPHLQLLQVGDLVLGDEPGAERAERVVRLALGPLAEALDLEIALGDVVADAVAGDMVQRVGFRRRIWPGCR